MVRCSDGSLYIGHTTDLRLRERIHNEGRGSQYTSKRRPVRIVWSEEHDSVQSAIACERQIKGWVTGKKEALIAGNLADLKKL